MFDSGKYWDERYMRGGNSGAGSYNKLAKFKSDVINGFIERNKIKSIVDYGVGDGNQLKLINTENLVYTGVDVSEFIISKCKQEFKDDKSKKFIQVDNIDNDLKAELALSCDVLYHLIEDDVYSDYMKNLFSMSSQYVIIYANDKDINHTIHVKFRKFSKYIESNLPQWYLIKHIPNKYPQLKLGKDNDNTSPSDFYIYKKEDEFLSITNFWKGYIDTHLMKIVRGLNVNLEGNIYSAHHSFDDTSNHLSNKRFNIYNVLKKTKPSTILEIGFNAGFSCLLMKLVVPGANITCVDLNQHLYVMPCFNKISSDFSSLRMIPGSSYDIGLPQLIKENKKFDFIHIDGDNRLEGARKDMELCLRLCHDETIILFDDTNLKNLDDLCSKYVTTGELRDYNFETYLNNQKYKHRFLQVDKTHSESTIPMLICGFPHSGTSILKSIIGHIEDVDEIIRETDYIDADRLNSSKHKFVLAKTSYLPDKIFTEKYDKYIKIFIARNPCYTYSSLNKRYNYKIPDELGIENNYVNFLKKVDYLINNKEKNTYVIFYEDLFDNNFKKLREILDTIGLKYTEQIFDNSKYNITDNKNIPKYPLLRNDHDSFRTYQIDQPLNNFNDMIDLTENQRDLIISHPLINKYFDTSVISTYSTSGLTSGLTFSLPIYISMTSIFSKQGHLFKTLQSITKQTRKVDKLFIFLSEDPYILDDGFKDRKITNPELLKFIDDNSFIDVKWVKNTGSYRKLLPLLKDKWDEDCIIITIDDDNIYDTNLIDNLVRDYYEQKCVIGYRGFTPLFDKIEDFDYSKRRGKLQNLSLYNFLTGKGGILYKPEFFHKTKNLVFNHEIYLNECNTHDDIWFYIVRILNNKCCYISNKKWDIRDLPNQGLFSNFNCHNNTNTVSFRRALKRIKELGYKF